MLSKRLLLFAGLIAQAIAPFPAAAGPEPRALTLDQALAELEARSLTLSQARSRAAEARAVVRQSAAPLLPTLVAVGNYTRNSDSAEISIGSLLSQLPLPPGSAQSIPANVVMQPLESFSVSGSLRVPILMPNAWADLAAATQAATAASASADAARLQIRAALCQAAWVGGAGEEIVAASERAVTVAQEQVRSAQRAVQAGTAAPLSILQAQTAATRRESDLVRARAELDRARLATGILLGKAEPVRITLGEPIASARLDDDKLVSEALAHRPEIAAQEALVRSAEKQLASARWRLAPQLSATGSVFASDVAYPTGKRQGWRATVDLTWSLYDGGFRYGKWRQAEAAIAGAEAGAEIERLEVVQEVQDAIRELGVSKERMRLGERQRELAAEAAASAKRSFAAGVAGSIEVLDANDRLFQAEVGLADARARLGTSAVNLDRAVGRSQ